MCARNTAPAKNSGNGNTVFQNPWPPGYHSAYRTLHQETAKTPITSREPSISILASQRVIMPPCLNVYETI